MKPAALRWALPALLGLGMLGSGGTAYAQGEYDGMSPFYKPPDVYQAPPRRVIPRAPAPGWSGPGWSGGPGWYGPGWRYPRWHGPSVGIYVAPPVPRYRPRYYTRRVSDPHVEWCYSQYRSYREWDNTWQPYRGPRRQCVSPYM